MTKVTNRPKIDLLGVIGECHLEIGVEVCIYKIMDITIERIIEEDYNTVIEMTLGEEILERHKTIEIRITEVDTETITKITIEIHAETTIEMTIEMKILEEVEVGLSKEDTQVMI